MNGSLINLDLESLTSSVAGLVLRFLSISDFNAICFINSLFKLTQKTKKNMHNTSRIRSLSCSHLAAIRSCFFFFSISKS